MIVFAWMALVIPGLVFVVSRCRGVLDGGLLPVLGLAWMCSFAAFFALAVPCFLLGASLDVYAVGVGVLHVWAAVEFVRRRLHRELKSLARDALGLEAIAVAAAVWGFARIGASHTGDALVHVTRVRQFLAHGLVNDDPWVAGDHFFTLYHTNLIHTLHALVSHVTGFHHVEVWRASLGLSALLAICGGAFLSWSLHRSRWAAWAGGLAAATAVAASAAPLLSLPNKIAPFFCIPIALGLALQALRGPIDRGASTLLAAAIVVTSATHSLYGIFAAVLLGPALALEIVRALRRDRAALRGALMLGATLLLALPMPLVSQMTKADWDAAPATSTKKTKNAGSRRPRQGPRKPVVPVTTKDEADRFIDAGSLGFYVDPLRGFGGAGGWKKVRFAGIRYLMLAVALGCGLVFTRRRREFATLTIIVASGAAILFIPPLASAFASLTGARWTLLRFSTAFLPMSFAAALAGAAVLAERRLGKPWLRWVGCLVVVALVLFAWGRPQVKSWGRQLDAARNGNIRLSPAETRSMIAKSEAMAEHVPSGATVLIDVSVGMELVRLYDVHILAPRRACLGVDGLNRLRRLNQRLIHDEMPWERRRRKLLEHDVRFFVPLTFPEWAVGHVANDIRDPRLGKGFVLLELDLD